MENPQDAVAAEIVRCAAVMPPPDDSLFASLSRKRKISKMWDTICGNAGADSGYQALFETAGGRPPDDVNRQPHKEQRKDSTTKMANWRVEDIDGGLAADFDDSLSGLGIELGTATYNMSEALLALPVLPVFKQEATENGCCQVTTTSPQTSTANSNPIASHVSSHRLVQNDPYTVNNSLLGSQNRFQYVLGAATSIATKLNEETLTYLNQGQSYEIKLKKLGDLTEFRGKMLKSIIRICFHERRLQYMEREQIASWRNTRPGERIVEIDVPLSYGICDVVQDQLHLNTCEFVWDPTKETGVFIRINCISTEFTPKKHGGEKGVPFRIQIETYTHGDGPLQRLHCASCQVKVFKPKGADRKHKTDREKMEKKTISEQEKFQPSYDCTVLTEVPLESVYGAASPAPPTVSSSISQKTETFQYSPSPDQRPPGTPTSMTADSPVGEQTSDSLDNPVMAFMQMYQQPLPSDSSAAQTAQWLQANRFTPYVRTFSSFSGADVLRLSRDDLIQICGLVDGIRLYNALHVKVIQPRLTLYVCVDPEQVYHAVYLENWNVDELLGKLTSLMNIPPQQIHDIFVQGPSGIHILVTDEVIQNIHDESMFSIEVIKDQASEYYRLLLKTANPC